MKESFSLLHFNLLFLYQRFLASSLFQVTTAKEVEGLTGWSEPEMEQDASFILYDQWKRSPVLGVPSPAQKC